MIGRNSIVTNEKIFSEHNAKKFNSLPLRRNPKWGWLQMWPKHVM